jgi:uncharacterized membrane protein
MSLPLSQSAQAARRGDVVRGLLTGVVPLVVLAILVALALLGAQVTRHASAALGFFAQERATLIVLVSGLVLALIAYGIAIWLMVRRVAQWQQATRRLRAGVALWTMAATALIIILPVLLAVLLPQHPAP